MTTMDSDSESQDSDEGRRFRFEATRKDPMGLQSHKTNTSSYRNPRRRSRSREDSRPKKIGDRQISERRKDRPGYDDRKNSKLHQNSVDSRRKEEWRHKERDLKNSHKETREPSRRDSRSRDSGRDSKSRDDKRKRSRDRIGERSRGKYRRYSRDKDRKRKPKSVERERQSLRDEKVKNNDDKVMNDDKNDRSNDQQECKDLNLSDFDIVSDTDGNSDNSEDIDEANDKFNRFEHNSNDEEKVKSSHFDKSGILNNPDDISDHLLASTSAISSNNNRDTNFFNYDNNGELEELDFVDDADNKESKKLGDKIYGPSLPPGDDDGGIARIIGPSLLENSGNCEGNEDGAVDAFGPILPPHLQKKSETEIVGSVLPDEAMEIGNEGEERGIGPLPPDHPALRDDLVQRQLEYRAQLIKRELAEMDNIEEKKREEWMTELPKVRSTNLDLGPRKFRMRAGPDLSDRSDWTDTPTDRARKQKERAMGKSTDNVQPEEIIPDKASKRKEKSLLDMHQKKLHRKKKKKEKEAKKTGKLLERRPFDRNIDLQANRFDDARRKTILAKAAGLDDRFSRGKI